MNNPFSEVSLGQNERRAVRDSHEHHLAALTLFSLAKREIRIFCRDLDPRILNHADIIESLSSFCREHRNSKLQILILDAEAPQKSGHRLVDLSQRLSSKIEVKKIHHEYSHLPFAFTTIDDRGLIYRSNATEFEGEVNFNAAIDVKEKNKLFQEVWDRSTPVSEWRRLHI